MSDRAKRLAPAAPAGSASGFGFGRGPGWRALLSVRPIAAGTLASGNPGEALPASTASSSNATTAPPPLSLTDRSTRSACRPSRGVAPDGDVPGRQPAAAGVGHHQHAPLRAAHLLLLQRLHLVARDALPLGEPVRGHVLGAPTQLAGGAGGASGARRGLVGGYRSQRGHL